MSYNGLSTDEKKSLFLIALKELAGNVTKSCEVAGVSSRQTFYNWMETDETFRAAVRAIQLEVADMMLDVAEDVLKFHLSRLDKDMAKWVLSKLGTKRGYGTKVEVEHTGDAFKGLTFPEEPASLEQWEAATEKEES
jgi:hypothetical protein